MKNIFSLAVLLFLGNIALAQTNSFSSSNPEPALEIVEKAAEFPGGEAAFDAFVAKNQRKLNVRRSDVSSNEVVLKFIVEKDGRLSTWRRVGTPPSVEMEEEAVMLLKKMTWTPAENKGQKVRSFVTMAIKFNLE